MKVVGIVCEYNPFHNGHKRLVDYARNSLEADCVIGVMSGDFLQRGEPALVDKYARAKMALLNGVDAIFELPAIFATASAREFATAAVTLLAKTGVVDTVLFGCESGTKEEFTDYAKKLLEAENSPAYSDSLKEFLAMGDSFALARSKALQGLVDSNFFNTPNNILGLEYTRAILEKGYPIDIACLKRDSGYLDASLEADCSSVSAAAIREALFKGNLSMEKYMPTSAFEILLDYKASYSLIFPDDLSNLLHYKLLSENDFEKYLDVDSNLNNKIKSNLNSFVSFTDFAMSLKSKDISYSRISRALCHILLGITKADFEAAKAANYITCLRLLGFSKNKGTLLSDIKENSKLPLITALGQRKEENKELNLMLDIDIHASDIYRSLQTGKCQKAFDNEYTKKYELCNL